MSDIDRLLDYMKDLGGGRGPASEQTMLDIAKGLNIQTSRNGREGQGDRTPTPCAFPCSWPPSLSAP